MSARPAPISRTDEILLHLVDRVEELIALHSDRGGAEADTASAPQDTPAGKPAKKTTTKRTRAKVAGD